MADILKTRFLVFICLFISKDEYFCSYSRVQTISIISIYKLGDVGISSNLIGSLSLTPGRWIMKQWPAGVNSPFAEVTENDILRTQDITIPNDTRKTTKLGMKVLRKTIF